MLLFGDGRCDAEKAAALLLAVAPGRHSFDATQRHEVRDWPHDTSLCCFRHTESTTWKKNVGRQAAVRCHEAYHHHSRFVCATVVDVVIAVVFFFNPPAAG